MSTGIILVLAGIMLQVIDFNFKLGPLTIDLASDIVGFLLIIIGLHPFLKEQNRLWKSCFKYSIILLIIEVVERISTVFDFGDSNATVSYLFMAVTSVIFMRFVYYYLESIVLQAKFMKIEIELKNLRAAFSAFCIMIIVYYLAVSLFGIMIINIITNILLVICAFYYCVTINSIRTTLYPPKAQSMFE